MVLGLLSKSKKGNVVHLDFTVHILDIKPWHPSQSLNSVRSVILQWKNSDNNSGMTNATTPFVGSTAAEGKIEFNKSFKLNINLTKESSKKGNNKISFQKNILEFNLYESRKDKSKGQNLGHGTVDFADYGLITEAVNVSIPVSSKRNYRNVAQPMLYVKIQPLDEERESSSKENLSKETSLDKDAKESVSTSTSEMYADETEIASFTDYDITSHSSEHHDEFSAQSSPDEQERYKDETEKKSIDGDDYEKHIPSDLGTTEVLKAVKSESTFSDFPDEDIVFIEVENSINQNVEENFLEKEINEHETIQNENGIDSTDESNDLVTDMDEPLEINSQKIVLENDTHDQAIATDIEYRESNNVVAENNESTSEMNSKKIVPEEDTQDQVTAINIVYEENRSIEESNNVITDTGEFSDIDCKDIVPKKDNNDQITSIDIDYQEDQSVEEETANIIDENDMVAETDAGSKATEAESTVNLIVDEDNSSEVQKLINDPAISSSTAYDELTHHVSVTEQQRFQQSTYKASVDLQRSRQKSIADKRSSTFSSETFENLKFSVRSPPHLRGSFRTSIDFDNGFRDTTIQDFVQDNLKNNGNIEITGKLEYTSSHSGKVRNFSRASSCDFSTVRIQELEHRIKLLEGELREAAAIEIGLYSIVAQHGSSPHKVHTAARRLSRLYRHASNEWPIERRATASRSIVSGLTLVTKACGNDVPRLTFWLSNAVVLRAIISETAVLDSATNEQEASSNSKIASLKWESISRKNKNFSLSEEIENWEDPRMFISALEKIETWMFTRIVESIWWQILTPVMQSTSEYIQQKMSPNANSTYQRTFSMGDQQQTNSSIEIWTKAFKDTSERICAARAAGHECGCLPLLAKMVMEQCAAKLDVSMLNAIMRDSDCEISSNPVSDPISDPMVLPIPPGEFSFATGAQLKNAIGYWSKCLSESSCIAPDEIVQDDDSTTNASALKPFPLMNALSDLLILPKDMLFDESIKKEVCPRFSTSLIKLVLSRFVPDELCPDPLPPTLLEALDTQQQVEISAEEISNIPCNMLPINYSPPSVDSIECFVGDIQSVSSQLSRPKSALFRKCHTSDDELDELDTPLASIMNDRSTTLQKDRKNNKFSSSPSTIRYQLLRAVWKEGE